MSETKIKKLGAGEHGVFPFEAAPPLRRPALGFLLCLAASAGLYLAVFSFVRKPFSIGIYRPLIEAKIQKFQASSPPRLLIIAGSNARISHQARVLEDILGIPSTNGGLTADLSLDFLLATYEPLLKSGDFVYLPLEYDPLAARMGRTRSERLYLSSYGRNILSSYPLRDRFEVLFSHELGDLFAEPMEIVAARSPKTVNRRSKMNEWGDQVGYTEESAKAFRERLLLSQAKPIPGKGALQANPPAIRTLGAFLDRCKAGGVTVIGGLPTTFVDRSLDDAFVQELAAFYRSHGQYFVVLPNRSQYPRDQFYDSHYHLVEPAAEAHTRLVAQHLKPFIGTR